MNTLKVRDKIHNTSPGFCLGGGSCTAAAFLREFTKCATWLHLDMAGVMESEGEVSYLGSGNRRPVTWSILKGTVSQKMGFN